MAEGENNVGRMMVDVGSGAAYALRSDRVAGGMNYTFTAFGKYGIDIRNDPVISETLDHAYEFEGIVRKHQEKLAAWENNESDDKGPKPELNLTPEQAFFAAEAQKLARSAEYRNASYEQFRDQLTVGDALSEGVYGKVPDDTPEIKAYVEANSGKTFGKAREDLATIVNAFEDFHINGRVGSQVEAMALGRVLNKVEDKLEKKKKGNN